MLTEFIIVLLLSFLYVFGILIFTGTLNSGWHFVDDHEYLLYQYDFQKLHMTLTDVVCSTTLADLGHRFRPLYYPLRILMVDVFGSNLFLFSVIKGCEIALTILLLYVFARRIQAGRIPAAFFALLTVTGYQSVVWWKLGPQEAMGTLLVAAGMNLLLTWLRMTDRDNKSGILEKHSAAFCALLT